MVVRKNNLLNEAFNQYVRVVKMLYNFCFFEVNLFILMLAMKQIFLKPSLSSASSVLCCPEGMGNECKSILML